MEKNIIEECYDKSIELLKNNSTKYGILASSPRKKAEKRNYLSVFARDASICILGMVMSGDKKLIATAKKSIESLAKYQAHNGQIPNYVKPETGAVNFWKFGAVDATLWWLIAIKFFDEHSGGRVKLEKKLKVKIEKAINWLNCQEHIKDCLVMQQEASDWADIMPRSGKVLYSNALWYKVKTLYKMKSSEETKRGFNNLFYPFNDYLKKLPRCDKIIVAKIIKDIKKTDYYLSYVNYLFWGHDIDVYGNSLAIIFGLSERKFRDGTIKSFLGQKRKQKLPIPVLFNPIKKGSKQWREYMEMHNQNFPYQYHNGGIWPYASCFWVIALFKSGKKKEAWIELEKIAQANRTRNWGFYEWFHGKTGKYNGMSGQSWNAGMFVFAYHYLKNEVKF